MLLAAVPGLFSGTATRARGGATALKRTFGRGLQSLGSIATAGASPGLAVASGLAATAVGASAAMLLRPPARPLQGLAAIAVTVSWVAARLVVMRLVDSARHPVGSARITAAWLPGAMVGLFALTPELRALTWFVGAALGLRSLTRAGVPGRQALRSIGWGYGVELAGLAGVALARDAGIALRLLGGS